MGKSADVPQAPDPIKTAEAQYAFNKKAAQFGLDNSRTTSVNPFGTSRWTNTPTFDQAGFDAAMAAYKPAKAAVYDSSSGQPSGPLTYGPEGDSQNTLFGNNLLFPAQAEVGKRPDRADFEKNNWTNTQTLSPESQGIYDKSTAKLDDAVGNLSTNPDNYNSQVADAIYSRMRRYQDPADAEARSVLQSNLADRGFQIGNEATSTEMTRLDDSQGRGRADAADQAVIQGMTQGRANQAQLAQIAQVLQGLRGSQVAGVGGASATTTPSVQAPDYTGLVNNQYVQQVNAANAENAGDNAMFGSLLSLGGMALGSPWLGGLMGGGAAAGGASALTNSFLPPSAGAGWNNNWYGI